MAKLIVLALCAVATVVIAEPPSGYLPPQARNSPSSTYGAPFGGSRNGNGNGNGNGKGSSFHAQRTGSKSFSYNSLHENQFGGAQSRKSFGNGGGFGSFGNGGGVSQQYGAPRQSYNGFGQSNGFRASGPSFGGASRGISQQYGAPSFGGASRGISQQYGAPSFGGPSNGFGSGPAAGFGGNGFGVSQQYGAPGFGGSFGGSSNGFGMSGAKFGGRNGYSAPAPAYGAPSSGYGAPYSKMDDDLSEPANYEYTYEVQAAEESGAEFGHQESREDESARGVYHVLLPDGRTQIVEYEADEEGFRPVIRYEESGGYPAAGGPQGPY